MTTIQRNDVLAVIGATAAILMIPLIAMQFSSEVDWNAFDFAVMGVLLAGAGFLIAFAARNVGNTTRRAAAILAIIAVLLFTWVELAVGLFGTPFAGS